MTAETAETMHHIITSDTFFFLPELKVTVTLQEKQQALSL